ncbi:MFS transporter [Nicoliella lavandulae]|uniref:MFS transporter n=1 Tax=Nicoliella lavandulae TaxID=3082954 RepID=A0ABU8SMI4_9LACO
MNQFKLKQGLFLNYLVHGFALIILTQNLLELAHNWNSTIAVASFVLSGIGIGRLVAYLIMGMLSDRFGRKQILLIGMSTYLLFFIVTPMNHSIMIAYGLSIIAGIANSALDSATYPLFTELSRNDSSNNILIKAFISIGEFILPLIVLFLKGHQLWFGISFLIPAAILGLNIINLITCQFPAKRVVDQVEAKQSNEPINMKQVALTTVLFIYGFTSMAVMIWFTQWITIFANQIGFSDVTAHLLLSLYSIGSITGVIASFLILKRFNARRQLFLDLNLVALIAIITVSASRIPLLSSVAAFAFGLSAAGGVMQMALNQLLAIFPNRKGTLTGIFFMFGSIASFTVPIISGFLILLGAQNILNGDIVIALISCLVAIVVFAVKPAPNSLGDARTEINQLDAKLIKILEQRFQAVKAVSHFKQADHIQTEDLKREQAVLNQVDQLTKQKDILPYNQNIIQNIMNNAKQYQNSLTQNKTVKDD